MIGNRETYVFCWYVHERQKSGHFSDLAQGLHVNSRVIHLNNVLNYFRKRWQVEYLSDLKEVHAHSARGDVVVIMDEVRLP